MVPASTRFGRLRRRRRGPFSLTRPRQGLTRPAISRLVNPAIERAVGLNQLNDIYARIGHINDPGRWVDRALQLLNIELNFDEAELQRIPERGPLIIVANHPFGAIDGMILISLLQRRRPADGKVMANFLLHRIRQLRPLLICVDPFGTPAARARNIGPMKEALRHLKAGGAIATFPAGEVAHLDLHQRSVTDPVWSETIGGLVRRTEATVTPIFFDGRNRALFQMVGLIHPRLRTAMLPRELLAKQGASLTVRIGNPVSPRKLTSFDDDQAITDYLRLRTNLLRHQSGAKALAAEQGILPTGRTPECIVEPVPQHVLQAEVDALPADALLVDGDDQCVYLAEANRIPNLLQEIGRLREVSFRHVGEGTGRSLDLDRFDPHYLHLFVWQPEKREVVGAYRLGDVSRIVNQFGVDGLYTATLFRFGHELVDQISPALELGRSFVRLEYQKSYAPLMNLWKGIGTYVARRPECCRLFGPVSISNDYDDESRRLMVEFLIANNLDTKLARFCKPRNPLRRQRRRRVDPGMSQTIRTIDEVSDLIAEIERQPRGVPILLKHYLRLNAQMLGFNIDPEFGDVLDGLVLIDLRKTDARILNKYMGKENYRAFSAYHAR